MAEKNEISRAPERANANFLRAVLSLDSSDPGLPRFVPPTSPVQPDVAPPARETRTWRFWTRRKRSRKPRS